MNYRGEIENIFGSKTFDRPLFYSYSGGLRFELSEGGTAIEQFLTALFKANKICKSIFSEEENITVCLRFLSGQNKFSHRASLQELNAAGIKIPQEHSIWSLPVTDDDFIEVIIAFSQPASLLRNLLWCALATDFGSIHPRPRCSIHLFNFPKGIMVLPYDDRGMDIAGPNHELLSKLYREHHKYLLSYDLELMQSTFGRLSNKSSQPPR